MNKSPRTLIRFSMLFYLVWLLLPAVQTTLRAASGGLCVVLFGIGALLDTETLKKQWFSLFLRAAAAAVMPLVLMRFLGRGGTEPAGFYVQNAMLWFPLVFAGHVRTVGDPALWKNLHRVMWGAIVITLLTTIGWLFEGFTYGDIVYAYSRMLGNASEQPELQKLYMQRNIGGYGFIYAMVVSLPLVCVSIRRHTGKKRLALLALLGLQLLVIVLSQYTTALLFTAVIMFLQLTACVLHHLSRKKLSFGQSLLCALGMVLGAMLFLEQLLVLTVRITHSLEMHSVYLNLQQLIITLQGGAAESTNRLAYYQTAIEGIMRSPWMGSMLGGEKLLSMHSDLLDLLSGMGIICACVVPALIWLMGRGSLRGLLKHHDRVQVVLSLIVYVAVAAMGTVVYSCDIMAVCMVSTLFVLEG